MEATVLVQDTKEKANAAHLAPRSATTFFSGERRGNWLVLLARGETHFSGGEDKRYTFNAYTLANVYILMLST